MAQILIVEDDLSINELLYRNLELVGHQCQRAYDGNEALACLKDRRPDLVLLDILLPGIDGLELLRRRPDNDVPVIMLTARNSLNDRVRGSISALTITSSSRLRRWKSLPVSRRCSGGPGGTTAYSGSMVCVWISTRARPLLTASARI